jgi:archaellum component FlaG (FlaF/FlaG flagellin family)
VIFSAPAAVLTSSRIEATVVVNKNSTTVATKVKEDKEGISNRTNGAAHLRITGKKSHNTHQVMVKNHSKKVGTRITTSNSNLIREILKRFLDKE